MPAFKDSKGREWTLPEFTEGTIIDLRKNCGIDLHLVMDRDEAEAAKAFSARGFSSMLWRLLEPQVLERGVEDLPECMNFAAKDAAKNAFIESMMTFYHGPEAGVKIAQALRPVEKAQMSKALAELKKQYGDSQALQA